MSEKGFDFEHTWGSWLGSSMAKFFLEPNLNINKIYLWESYKWNLKELKLVYIIYTQEYNDEERTVFWGVG